MKRGDNNLKTNVNCEIKRGDIYFADLNGVRGSEQGGIRPIVVIQNDIGNKYSPVIIVAAITSKISKAKLPTHIELDACTFGLPKDSVILMEQIRTIDKSRLSSYITHLSDEKMKQVNESILVSLGIRELVPA